MTNDARFCILWKKHPTDVLHLYWWILDYVFICIHVHTVLEYTRWFQVSPIRICKKKTSKQLHQDVNDKFQWVLMPCWARRFGFDFSFLDPPFHQLSSWIRVITTVDCKLWNKRMVRCPFTPLKTNMSTENHHFFSRRYIFKWLVLHCHVSFSECNIQRLPINACKFAVESMYAKIMVVPFDP